MGERRIPKPSPNAETCEFYHDGPSCLTMACRTCRAYWMDLMARAAGVTVAPPSDPAAPLREALRLRWDSIRPDEEPTMLDTDVAVFYLRIGDVRAALTQAPKEADR